MSTEPSSKISELPGVVAANMLDADVLAGVFNGITSKASLSDVRLKVGVSMPTGGRLNTSPTTYLDNMKVFNARDWLDSAGGGVTQTVAAQGAAAAACAWSIANNGARLYFPGNWAVTDTLLIDYHRVHVEGDGKYATKITFTPTSAKPLFKVFLASTELSQGSFRKMSLVGAGTQQKIGFDLWDVNEFLFDEILVQSSWTGNSGSGATPSIGFRTNGRDLNTFRQLDVYADRPFHLRANPNHAAIGADHFHFQDTYWGTLIAAETGMLIDEDCPVTNLTFDGYQSWTGGTYGVYKVGPGGAASFNVNVNNARFEQPGATGGFAFRWEGPLTGLNLTGDNFGGLNTATNGGVKLRHVSKVKLDTCVYTGSIDATAIAIDADSTCDDILFLNTFFQVGSFVSLPGFEQSWGLPSPGLNHPIPPTSHWHKTTVGYRDVRVIALTVDNGQIKFPAVVVPSTDANTIDDYEEGTFTPVLKFGGATTGITYGTQAGRYTKVGNIVTVNFTFALTSKGSAVGAATVTGLPFPAKNSASYFATAALGVSYNFGGSVTVLPTAQLAPNTSIASLFQGLTSTALANTDFTNTTTVNVNVTYEVEQ